MCMCARMYTYTRMYLWCMSTKMCASVATVYAEIFANFALTHAIGEHFPSENFHLV